MQCCQFFFGATHEHSKFVFHVRACPLRRNRGCDGDRPAGAGKLKHVSRFKFSFAEWRRKNGPHVNVRDLIAAVAGPMGASDNRKSWLARAASESGVSFRLIKALFYGERKPCAKTIAKLKEAAGRYEAQRLAERFDGLAHALDMRDADFHGEDVAALLNAARALRGLNRTGDDSS